jgi:hypothetical protein
LPKRPNFGRSVLCSGYDIYCYLFRWVDFLNYFVSLISKTYVTCLRNLVGWDQLQGVCKALLLPLVKIDLQCGGVVNSLELKKLLQICKLQIIQIFITFQSWP